MNLKNTTPYYEKDFSKNAVVVVAKLCPTHCNAMD